MPQIVVIRHPRENLKKCSLRGLESRENFAFFKAKDGFLFDATGYILLQNNAPEISEKDKGLPILLLDSTWALLPKVRNKICGTPILRGLPSSIKTAYPRVSKSGNDPQNGLATVEALFAALSLSGQRDESLLQNYVFKDTFLQLNKGL